MSEAKRNNRTLKEIVSDATDRDLERYETGILTPDRLKKLASDADKRKKRRHRRIAGIAALFAVVVAGAIMVFDFADTDVEADKNSKEEIVTEDGVIIEDGGWGSERENCLTVTSWNELKATKETIPQMIIPNYIPKGYKFEKAVIEEIGNIINIEFTFTNSNTEEFIINQCLQNENLKTIYLTGDRTINSKKGTVYIMQYSENNKATIQIDDDFVIEIWSEFSDDEIKKIIDNI